MIIKILWSYFSLGLLCCFSVTLGMYGLIGANRKKVSSEEETELERFLPQFKFSRPVTTYKWLLIVVAFLSFAFAAAESQIIFRQQEVVDEYMSRISAVEKELQELGRRREDVLTLVANERAMASWGSRQWDRARGLIFDDPRVNEIDRRIAELKDVHKVMNDEVLSLPQVVGGTSFRNIGVLSFLFVGLAAGALLHRQNGRYVDWYEAASERRRSEKALQEEAERRKLRSSEEARRRIDEETKRTEAERMRVKRAADEAVRKKAREEEEKSALAKQKAEADERRERYRVEKERKAREDAIQGLEAKSRRGLVVLVSEREILDGFRLKLGRFESVKAQLIGEAEYQFIKKAASEASSPVAVVQFKSYDGGLTWVGRVAKITPESWGSVRPKRVTPHAAVLDGSNIARWRSNASHGQGEFDYSAILEVIEKVKSEHGIETIRLLFDWTDGWLVGKKSQQKDELESLGVKVEVVPENLVADLEIIKVAKQERAIIISNDNFLDHPEGWFLPKQKGEIFRNGVILSEIRPAKFLIEPA